MSIYRDLDITMKKHPGNKDVMRKTDVNSVRFALRNIFMSNQLEKPFEPLFGLGLRNYLFENYSPAFANVLKRKCIEMISIYEPRVIVDDLKVFMDDSNNLDIELWFHIIADPEPYNLNINLERGR